uniref:Peptidase C-terminal archaeal/bacterial domain-containing protein n=1 Tax=Tetradesmus obliquus TaxID=3088 RepID=A0A383V6Z4_TETOB|eukprot:jgi/Sobl393_1/8696/SZX60911.1
MTKPVARPGVLKGFQLKPASGSSGDDVVASAVDAQFTGAIQRSMETSGFKGSQAQLITRLRNDDDLGVHLDAEALMFECRSMLPPKNPATTEAGTVSAQTDLSVTTPDPLADQAFVLSSRPSSKNKLWLDFKGSSIEGTAWNAFAATIVTPAYSRDDDFTTFNPDERTDIVAVWRAVSEDYAPFDIDVTTIPPTVPVTNYVRVIIGGDGAWYGSPGGLSYVGVFGRDNLYYNPVFIFPKMLGPNNPKYMWEAISHEVGHNMGLYHDGDASTAYYEGHGIWAPIMGIGYYKPLTQFSKGEYPGANQLQDDLAIIAAKIGYAPKVNGDSMATATGLKIDSTSGSTASSIAYGVVAQAGVPEFFKFMASAGPATVKTQLTPSFTNTLGSVDNRADLDMRVTVYDAAGAIVTTLDPASFENAATLEIAESPVTLPADGVYYVGVTGAGSGDPKSTGYSDYGSLGRFALSLTYPAPAGGNPVWSTPNPPSPSTPPTTPPPSPSPPPVTVQNTMNVALRVSQAYSRTLAAYTCTAVVTVRLTDGSLVGGAQVVGRWAALPAGTAAAASFTTVARGATRATGAPAGTFTSVSKPLPNTSTQCVFAVTAVRKTGLVLSSARLPRLSAARKRSATTP